MTDIADYETFEVIVEYLERQGITDLRQRHAPDQVNKSAVVRYLVAAALQNALDHPPAGNSSVKRSGAARRSRKQTVVPSSGKKRI